ncbi:MAG: hypothetical protein M1831_000091 [Alyxoria varia]|nr:MAG: hypothetical protein M1831_000091 [Alyxoria varia]
MDPITAISLTCNIFQLVELSFKLIAQTKNLHHQANAYIGEGGVVDSTSEFGALPAAYADAEIVTSDLKRYNDRLEIVLEAVDGNEADEHTRDNEEGDYGDSDSQGSNGREKAAHELGSDPSNAQISTRKDTKAESGGSVPVRGESSAAASAITTRTEAEVALLALSRACNAVARQLLSKLDKLKVRVREGDPRGKIVWKSARGAVKGMWAKGELEELVERVEGYKKEIQLRLTVDLRDRLAQAQTDASSRFNGLDQSTKDLAVSLAENKTHFTTLQEIQTDYLTRLMRAHHEEILGRLVDANLTDASQPPPPHRYIDDRNPAPRGSNMNNAADETLNANIISAARTGNISTIRTIIRRNPQAILADDKTTGQTALHVAAETGNLELVIYCIRNGALLNIDDEARRVPLHLAVHSDSDDIVRTLVSKGADATARDANGKRPIDYAQPDSLISWILQYGANLEVRSDDERVTALYYFAAIGDVSAVRTLLNQNAATDFADQAGRTPLIIAAERGHAVIVDMLLVSGAVDVDTKTTDEGTALGLAISNGHLAVVQILLTHDADTELLTKEGCASLHIAAHAANLDVLETLLDYGVDIEQRSFAGSTPLARAAWLGRVKVANMLLSRDPPARTDSHKYGDGRTPLILAAYRGGTKMVGMLLNKGQDGQLELTDNKGLTALYHATTQNHPETVIALIERGADPNVGDQQHLAINKAAQLGNYNLVAALLAAGAKVEARGLNDCSRTPLAEAAHNGHADIVKLLLDHGADVNARHSTKHVRGYTVLTWATVRGHTDVVKLLLDYGGANIEGANQKGWTALTEAAWHGHIDIVKELVQRDANANHRHTHGYTPLHRAAIKGLVPVVRDLIKGGANVNAADESGWTSMAAAAEHGKPGVVKLLLSSGARTDTKNNRGFSPREQAKKRQHWSIVGLIEEAEAQMKAKEPQFPDNP